MAARFGSSTAASKKAPTDFTKRNPAAAAAAAASARRPTRSRTGTRKNANPSSAPAGEGAASVDSPRAVGKATGGARKRKTATPAILSKMGGTPWLQDISKMGRKSSSRHRHVTSMSPQRSPRWAASPAARNSLDTHMCGHNVAHLDIQTSTATGKGSESAEEEEEEEEEEDMPMPRAAVSAASTPSSTSSSHGRNTSSTEWGDEGSYTSPEAVKRMHPHSTLIQPSFNPHSGSYTSPEAVKRMRVQLQAAEAKIKEYDAARARLGAEAQAARDLAGEAAAALEVQAAEIKRLGAELGKREAELAEARRASPGKSKGTPSLLHNRKPLGCPPIRGSPHWLVGLSRADAASTQRCLPLRASARLTRSCELRCARTGKRRGTAHVWL